MMRRWCTHVSHSRLLHLVLTVLGTAVALVLPLDASPAERFLNVGLFTSLQLSLRQKHFQSQFRQWCRGRLVVQAIVLVTITTCLNAIKHLRFALEAAFISLVQAVCFLFLQKVFQERVVDLDNHIRSIVRTTRAIGSIQDPSYYSVDIQCVLEEHLSIQKNVRRTSADTRRLLLISYLRTALLLIETLSDRGFNSRSSPEHHQSMKHLPQMLLALYLAVKCGTAAAQISHRGRTLLRSASNLSQHTLFASSPSPAEDTPSSRLAISVDRHRCLGLVDMLSTMPVGISIYGVVLSRELWLRLLGPMVALLLFVLQRLFYADE